MAGRLDVLAGQWNEEIRKVTEQQKMTNKSVFQHFDRMEAQLKLLSLEQQSHLIRHRL